MARTRRNRNAASATRSAARNSTLSTADPGPNSTPSASCPTTIAPVLTYSKTPDHHPLTAEELLMFSRLADLSGVWPAGTWPMCRSPPPRVEKGGWVDGSETCCLDVIEHPFWRCLDCGSVYRGPQYPPSEDPDEDHFGGAGVGANDEDLYSPDSYVDSYPRSSPASSAARMSLNIGSPLVQSQSAAPFPHPAQPPQEPVFAANNAAPNGTSNVNANANANANATYQVLPMPVRPGHPVEHQSATEGAAPAIQPPTQPLLSEASLQLHMAPAV